MVGTLAVHFTKASVKRELTALYYIVKICEIFVQNWGAMWSMSTLRDFSKYQRIKSSLQRIKSFIKDRPDSAHIEEKNTVKQMEFKIWIFEK